MNEILFTKTMDHPRFDALEVIFEATDEDEAPENHFELQEHIDFANNFENKAAWFTACVKVKLRGTNLYGLAFLTCCSYSSFEEFLKSDDYFQDMIKEATLDLVTELKNDIEPINEFMKEYRTKY